MNIPQIRMESKFARIGIAHEPPVQEMEQPKAELSIQQPPAELTIERIPGKLTIDQVQAWEEMNLKSPFRLTEEFAQTGYHDWLNGMGRIAEQGDELMRIENGGNPIADQAKENSENPLYEFNIGWIPSPFSVKINYTPGKIEIQSKVNKPIIEANPNKPVHRYRPGKVNIYVERLNSLAIDFVNRKV
ncbi:hypothetical protein DCC39_05230 [Pueribacillus theae]|uniref:YviE n=1 Tax=Pueribacillus theae TaxID=2171751 RepID=A0A2U1K532_9BACI|nr:DUF6470 family protein [Pueribacillus theae]PWA12626.1 hypothetical protein DCC39_05230 [Pueribacillus theae]